jgi:hypothetical protein
LIRSFPRSSVAAATLTVHLARSHGSIVEDFEAVLSQFATIAVQLYQPRTGGGVVVVWQATQGSGRGAEISTGACANCQIDKTTPRAKTAYTKISRMPRPFSSERTKRA